MATDMVFICPKEGCDWSVTVAEFLPSAFPRFTQSWREFNMYHDDNEAVLEDHVRTHKVWWFKYRLQKRMKKHFPKS